MNVYTDKMKLRINKTKESKQYPINVVEVTKKSELYIIN